jgi:hypothetical protein
MRSLTIKILMSVVVVPILTVIILITLGNQRAHVPATMPLAAYPLPGTPVARVTREPYPLPGKPTELPNRRTSTASAVQSAAYPLPGSGTPTALSPRGFLPLVFGRPPYKGTAGFITSRANLGFTNEITMGVTWGYNWSRVFTPTDEAYSLPYQAVNSVRSWYIPTIPNPTYITWRVYFGDSTTCPGALADPDANTSPITQTKLRQCVSNVAKARPGMYWLVWNEPEWFGQDNISPTLGARYFKEISDTILGADPTARLIVGNVGSEYPPSPATSCGYGQGCGSYWLTDFVSQYQSLYGVTPYNKIAGYGFHAYAASNVEGLGLINCSSPITDVSQDGCLLNHWIAIVNTGINWVANHDPGKEVWITEMNWRTDIVRGIPGKFKRGA